MRVPLSTLAAAALLTGLVATTGAAAPSFVGSFRDWNVYTVDQNGQTICYIASVPKKQDGNWNNRGDPALLVTRLPNGSADEVSVQPGYSFKPESTVEVKIGGRSWELFTQGEHAWATTSEDDQALVAAMKAGSDLTVRGTSTRDTFSLDTFSLLGFTAAHQAMVQACQ